MRRLAAAGRTIVFISHKLGEVLALADTITVVRRGRIVWSGGADATDAATLATFIVGQQLEARTPLAPAAPPGDEALRVAGLSVADDHGRIAIRGAAFAVRAERLSA